MTLVDALKAKATQFVAQLEAANPPFTRDQIKALPFDLLAMEPSALQPLIQAGVYMAEFTKVIAHPDNKPSLMPWVTVYGAGLGMQAVFNRILFVWARTPVPSPANPAIPPTDVTKAIDEDIPRYVKLIST